MPRSLSDLRQSYLPRRGAESSLFGSAVVISVEADEKSWSRRNEGKISSITYPSAFDASGNTQAGPVYTYTYDTMSRPIAG
jgi:hypothetical protein